MNIVSTFFPIKQNKVFQTNINIYKLSNQSTHSTNLPFTSIIVQAVVEMTSFNSLVYSIMYLRLTLVE